MRTLRGEYRQSGSRVQGSNDIFQRLGFAISPEGGQMSSGFSLYQNADHVDIEGVIWAGIVLPDGPTGKLDVSPKMSFQSEWR